MEMEAINKSNIIQPYASYFGGKAAAGVYHTIINNIPQHSVYIEAFLGNGTIMRIKKPCKLNIGIDKDSGLIDKYNYNSHGKNFIFVNGDFLILSNNSYNHLCCSKKTFIYADPPYLHSTRKSANKYNHELSIEEHIKLLEFANSCKCNIMLSCYDSKLYRDKLKNFNKINFQGWSRGGKTIETIYMNYDLKTLHDTALVGKNFTDRQRIKRKVKREIEKLKKLGNQERQTIIDAINYEFRNK